MSDPAPLLAQLAGRNDGWAVLTRLAVHRHGEATDPIERAHLAERAAYYASHVPGQAAREMSA